MELTLCEFADELQPAFCSITSEWLGEMFTVEPHDAEVLSKPRELIVDKGGVVLFAKLRDPDAGIDRVVGTCAIMKTSKPPHIQSDHGELEEPWYELTKVGVTKEARGKKVGEWLLVQMLRRAEELGIAHRLFLVTHSKCAAAVHLYEKLGFEHDAEVLRGFGARYSRANVSMV
eukprot:TRINITY_DN2532_c0_g1_i1.p1 TRINITY_DN2532_c0_g1~~TRINITY_DN2532_c0_g1_i1.p1  ORF type:complete len:174 (+),score=24.10 TRINITY_DN2532_c0_g1_i1:149-670(+)